MSNRTVPITYNSYILPLCRLTSNISPYFVGEKIINDKLYIESFITPHLVIDRNLFKPLNLDYLNYFYPKSKIPFAQTISLNNPCESDIELNPFVFKNQAFNAFKSGFKLYDKRNYNSAFGANLKCSLNEDIMQELGLVIRNVVVEDGDGVGVGDGDGDGDGDDGDDEGIPGLPDNVYRVNLLPEGDVEVEAGGFI